MSAVIVAAAQLERLQKHCPRRVRLITCTDIESLVMAQAWRSSQTIELNLAYFQRFSADFINELITHEVAHLIAPDEEDDHGPEWCRIVQELGGKAIAVYHDVLPATEIEQLCA